MKTLLGLVVLVTFLPLFASAAVFETNLRYGDRGARVEEMQLFLSTFGFLKSNPTGNYLGATRAAVQSFQRSVGIDPTGFWGPLTRAAANTKQAGGNVPSAPTSNNVSGTASTADDTPSGAGSTLSESTFFAIHQRRNVVSDYITTGATGTYQAYLNEVLKSSLPNTKDTDAMRLCRALTQDVANLSASIRCMFNERTIHYSLSPATTTSPFTSGMNGATKPHNYNEAQGAACTWNTHQKGMLRIEHGKSVTGWIGYGAQCVSDTYTCVNGVLKPEKFGTISASAECEPEEMKTFVAYINGKIVMSNISRLSRPASVARCNDIAAKNQSAAVKCLWGSEYLYPSASPVTSAADTSYQAAYQLPTMSATCSGTSATMNWSVPAGTQRTGDAWALRVDNLATTCGGVSGNGVSLCVDGTDYVENNIPLATMTRTVTVSSSTLSWWVHIYNPASDKWGPYEKRSLTCTP